MQEKFKYETPEIYNEAFIKITDLGLETANKIFKQLGMTSSNRFAAPSFNVDLHRWQYHKASDHLSYVQSNMSILILEQNVIYDQLIQTVNNVPRETVKIFIITSMLAAIRS